MPNKNRCEDLEKKVNMLAHELAVQNKELERLRSSEELYRDFIEGTNDLVTRVDGKGRFTFVNRAGEKVFGCPIGQCVGKMALDFIHPGDRDTARTAFDGWIKARESNLTFETRLVNQVNGEVFDMMCTVNLRYDSEGKLIGINSIARDLTARKRWEKDLKELTQKLSERVKELNCLYEISKLREKHDFSLDEIIQQIVDLIPQSLRYPEIACAQVRFDGYAYGTANFRSTPWQISCQIKVHHDPVCVLEVGYLLEKPDWKTQPFLEEEQALINSIAERISNIIEREWAEIELRNHREQLEALLSQRTTELEKSEERLQLEILRREKAETALHKVETEE